MASSVEVLLWALTLTLAATGYAHGVRACDSDSQNMRCSCSSGLTGGVTVDCVGEGLEEVPDGIPPRTTILQLNDNSIRALPRNRFSRFPDLTRLYIDHNGLSDIRTGAFYHLNLLDLLSLQYNKLTSLPCSEFSSLPNLRRLKFSGNPISSIPDNCFDDLVNLERLYLQNMRLRTISHVPFQRLSNLRHLDISGNRLSTLPPAFCNQGQNLIPSIGLDANPWVCDCELIPIRSCSNVSSAIKCAMPSTLRGLTMGTVSSERMGCSSTSITVDPSETVATAGQAVYITCQADGVEERDVTWWKMSKSIGVELFRNDRMLTFERVKPENAGIYMCEALTSWAVASLVVLPAPPTTTRPSTTVQTTVTPTKKTSLPANPFGGPTSTDAPSPTRASSKNNTPLPNAGGPMGGGTTTVTNTPKQVSKKGNLEGGGSGQFDWKMVAAAAGGAIVTLLIIGGVCYVWNQRRWKKSLQKYEGPVPLGDLESAHDDDSDSVRSARSNRSNRSNRSKSSNSIPVRKPPRAIPDQIDDSNQEDIDLYVDMENAPPRRSGRRPAGSRANTARRHGSNLAVNNPSRRGSRTSLASRASSRASSRGPTRGNPSARRPRSGYTSADSARASRRRDDLMPSQRVVIEVDDYDEDDYQDTPDGTPVNPRRANMKSPLVGVKRGTMSRSRSSENARRAAYNGDREIDIDSGKGSSKDITMLTSDEDYNGIHSDVSLTKGRRKRPMEFDGRRHSDMVY